MRIPLDWAPPSKADYLATTEKLSSALSSIPSTYSVLLYGSVARNKFVPGRSDLDLAIVQNADVLTNKEHVLQAAHTISELTSMYRVELQINFFDTTTLRDGRFSTLDAYFMQHLQKEGRVLHGVDFRKEASARPIYHTKENTLGMRLRQSRVRLLDAPFHAAFATPQFAYDFGSCLEKTIEVALEAVEYVTGGIPDFSKNGALGAFEEVFPTINTKRVRDIAQILDDYSTFNDLRRDPQRALPLWVDALTFTEGVLCHLIHSTKGPATQKI